MSGGFVIVEDGVVTGANVGGFFEVFKNKVANVLNFRTLQAGDNISITENTNDLDIDATNTFLLGVSNDNSFGAGTTFYAFFSNSDDPTESDTQGFIAIAYTIVRRTLRVNTNSSDDTFVSVVRDDGVDVPNTTLTVPSSTTGSFDSGVISELIAANSLTNIEYTRNGSASIVDTVDMVECEK